MTGAIIRLEPSYRPISVHRDPTADEILRMRIVNTLIDWGLGDVKQPRIPEPVITAADARMSRDELEAMGREVASVSSHGAEMQRHRRRKKVQKAAACAGLYARHCGVATGS